MLARANSEVQRCVLGAQARISGVACTPHISPIDSRRMFSDHSSPMLCLPPRTLLRGDRSNDQAPNSGWWQRRLGPRDRGGDQCLDVGAVEELRAVQMNEPRLLPRPGENPGGIGKLRAVQEAE